MALATGGVGADGAWSGSGHPPTKHLGPLTQRRGEGFGEPGWPQRQDSARWCPGEGGKPEPPVLLCGAPAGSRPHSPQQAEGGEQLRPFARRGSGGSHSPSPLGGSLDGRRLHVRNVFTGICHHLLTSLTPTPPFFPPLTATRPEGSMRVGAMGKRGLGFFCSNSLEKNIRCLFPSSKAWVWGRNCFLQQEKPGKREMAFPTAYPIAVLVGSTLSWAPQNICGLWKLLKTPCPPAPSLSQACIGVGCACSIISTRLAAVVVV